MPNYRAILRTHFEDRIQRNSRYSMRAFARDIGLPAHRLSEVFSGKQGISRQVANRIVERLHMSPDDGEIFCDLVDIAHARSSIQRVAAMKRLEARFKIQENYNSLELDQFRVISEWYHLAILELANLKNFRGEIAWISSQLGISLPEANAAVERLIRVKLMQKDASQKLVAVHQVNETKQVETPSEFIRAFHRRVIRKSIDALEKQPVNQREFSTLFLSIKDEDVPKAKETIRTFWRGFCEEFNCVGEADSVYSLTTQFFELTSSVEENDIPL